MKSERTTVFNGANGVPVNDFEYRLVIGSRIVGSLKRVDPDDVDHITKNGNDITGLWALRDADGTFIDYDQYRFDIAARFGFEIVL